MERELLLTDIARWEIPKNCLLGAMNRLVTVHAKVVEMASFVLCVFYTIGTKKRRFARDRIMGELHTGFVEFAVQLDGHKFKQELCSVAIAAKDARDPEDRRLGWEGCWEVP